jgi:ribonuclease HIII
VAAASIIAREGFINWLERKGKELGTRLERGVSSGVKETAKKLVELKGPQALREVAKVHFRTAHEIAPAYICRAATSRRLATAQVLKRYQLKA